MKFTIFLGQIQDQCTLKFLLNTQSRFKWGIHDVGTQKDKGAQQDMLTYNGKKEVVHGKSGLLTSVLHCHFRI